MMISFIYYTLPLVLYRSNSKLRLSLPNQPRFQPRPEEKKTECKKKKERRKKKEEKNDHHEPWLRLSAIPAQRHVLTGSSHIVSAPTWIFFPPLFSRRQIGKSLFVRRTADATVDRYRNLGMEHLARSVTYLDTLPSPVCSAYYLPYRSMCERVIASSG